MRLFRHRKQIRNATPARDPRAMPYPLPTPRFNAGYPKAGMFAPDKVQQPSEAHHGVKVVDKLSETQVGLLSLARHNEDVKENKMNKSYRVAMAQALITELAEAHERHGDTDGTRRLQAMVARMVNELLFR